MAGFLSCRIFQSPWVVVHAGGGASCVMWVGAVTEPSQQNGTADTGFRDDSADM